MNYGSASAWIDPQDLLGRNITPVYGEAARQLIAGRVAVVTGAGGSIGSEIVRQLILLEARYICFVDHDESALHKLQLELDGIGLLDDDRFMLADIRDHSSIDHIFESVQPDLVFHAAAHKHLPLLERSPAAGIQTNILGTETIAAACVKHGVERFINISTDKAASPVSVLGMTKRLAELMAASYTNSSTRIASVRFGNVLGSRGSFLPTLAQPRISHFRSSLVPARKRKLVGKYVGKTKCLGQSAPAICTVPFSK